MRIVILLLVSLLIAFPAFAQEATPAPLTQTYLTTNAELLTFDLPEGWFVFETDEFLFISDSLESYTQIATNPDAPMQPGMIAMSVVRPRSLQIGLQLPADATLTDLITLLPIGSASAETIMLGDYEALRIAYPPQRFDSLGFAFDIGDLYFVTVSAATGTLPTIEPTIQAILASFALLNEGERVLEEIEVDLSLLDESHSLAFYPVSFSYPANWMLTESEFGAIQLANINADGTIYSVVAEGVVRIQISFVRADLLPFALDADASAREVLEVTAAADESVLAMPTPYSGLTEFLVGGREAARMESRDTLNDTALIVVKLDQYYATLKMVTYPGELELFEPFLLAITASFVQPEILEATAEATAEVTVTPTP